MELILLAYSAKVFSTLLTILWNFSPLKVFCYIVSTKKKKLQATWNISVNHQYNRFKGQVAKVYLEDFPQLGEVLSFYIQYYSSYCSCDIVPLVPWALSLSLSLTHTRMHAHTHTHTRTHTRMHTCTPRMRMHACTRTHAHTHTHTHVYTMHSIYPTTSYPMFSALQHGGGLAWGI